MKGKAISLVGILCIACLIVSGANAKGKPNKPGGSGIPEAEEITFWGDLEGSQIVENCCPNQGPFPEYTMTLGGEALWLTGIPGTYDGQLNISSYGHPPGQRSEFIVQFWSDSPAPLAIQIIGGVAEIDRKNKSVAVTFTNEECVDMNTGEFIALVNFRLETKPHLDQTFADGTAQSSLRPSASELTTVVPVAEPVEAGDVLVIDPGQPTGFGLGRHGGDPAVFGIVYTKPGVLSGVATPAAEVPVVQVPLVFSGLALCKVDAGYGSILPGDLLETSPTPGHAKRAYDPQPGAVLGKALESLDVGTGLIKVLVVLR